MLTHTGEKDHECPKCGKKFNQKCSMLAEQVEKQNKALQQEFESLWIKTNKDQVVRGSYTYIHYFIHAVFKINFT